jgi:hypothetical protein
MESGQHLRLLCPYAQAAWNQVAIWEHIVLPQQAHPSNFDNIRDWWELAEKHVQKKISGKISME